jgi:micrococcal nuclease
MISHRVRPLVWIGALLLCAFLAGSAEPQLQPAPEAAAVYVTKTGKKYHRDGCQHVRKSKIKISLAEAKKRDYTPCSVCNPPK